MPGAAVVVAIAIGVWWVRVPGLSSFIFFPPLLLGVGVGVVARYSTARPAVLVVAAVTTTAIQFGFAAARWSAYGVHGRAMSIVMAFAACVVAETALAAGVGALVGRRRRATVPCSTTADRGR